MQINWFTVIAQVLNFFLLMWLLKRYLYKPILVAIDEREKKITSQLKEAADKKAEAEKEEEDFRNKNETFDQQKQALMDKAVAETKASRKNLLEAARNEASALQSKLEKAALTMQESRNLEIAEKTKLEVFAIARKTLQEIASMELEEQATQVFLKRLSKINPAEKLQFNKAFKPEEKSILVRSAFELPEKQQTEIKRAIHEILGTKFEFQFEIKPELISGIEMVTNGYKLSWSISGHLDSMEKNISIKSKETAAPEKEQHVGN